MSLADCHKPKPIQEFAIDQWKGKIIPGMSVKAKLSPEQTQSLEEYVMAVKRWQLLGSEHAKARPATTPVSAMAPGSPLLRTAERQSAAGSL